MAANDARPIPKKNTALRLTFAITPASGVPISGATGLDTEISLNGGAFADATNEATEIGTSGFYYLDLTAAEMDADTVAIIVKTSSAGAIPPIFVLYPEEAGDIRATAVVTDVDATGDDAIADALLDRTAGVETNLTVREYLRLSFAVLLGKSSDVAIGAGKFRDRNDTKDRVTATTAAGNRTAVTYDPS